MKKRNTLVKKAQTNIIIIILIILLVLALIIIVWILFSALLHKNAENVEFQTKMFGVNMGIVDPDFTDPNIMILSVTRGSDKYVESNTSTIIFNVTIPIKADIVSAIDVSNSMNDRKLILPSNCFCEANYSDESCTKHNCSSLAGCNMTHNSDFLNGICTRLSFNPECCKLNHSCSDSSSCSNCGGTPILSGYIDEYYCLYFGVELIHNTIDCAKGYNVNTKKYYCDYWCEGNLITEIKDDVPVPVKCNAIPGTGCCNTSKTGIDCATEAGCAQCHNGIWNATTSECHFNTYSNPCIRSNNLSTEAGCNACKPRPEDGWFHHYNPGKFACSFKINTPTPTGYLNIKVGDDCGANPYNWQNCKYGCKGKQVAYFPDGSKHDTCSPIFSKSKLESAKEANAALINTVLQKNQNQLSIALYSNLANATGLTKDKDYLNKVINISYGEGNTNICQGINQSIEVLKNSVNFKAIILMTDGEADVTCNGAVNNVIAKQEAISMAESAYQNFGIRIYTIGFGENSDTITLQKIAAVSNGSYFFANVSNLENIYNQVSIEIQNQTVTTYSSQSWFYIRAVVYNNTNSYTDINYTVPLPLETRKLSFKTGGLTNIKKIEIYLAAMTPGGREILRLLDSWQLATYR